MGHPKPIIQIENQSMTLAMLRKRIHDSQLFDQVLESALTGLVSTLTPGGETVVENLSISDRVSLQTMLLGRILPPAKAQANESSNPHGDWIELIAKDKPTAESLNGLDRQELRQDALESATGSRVSEKKAPRL